MSAARTVMLSLLGSAMLCGVAVAQTPAPADAGAPAAGSAGAVLGDAALAPRRAALSEGVAASVNDDIISTYDLRQRVLMVLVLNGVQPTEQNLREIERESLRSLVDERLEMEEIKHIQEKNKDVHLEPSAKEIDEEIDSMAQQYGVKRPQLEATLRSAGVDMKTLKDQITTQMAWRSYIGGRFHSSIHIGDERVNQEQVRINASASKAQYQVSEILIDPAKAGGEQQAMTGAQQLVEQIKKGAPFSAVARQFSALPTAANGGDAGWLSSGEVAAPLEKVLDTMRPGQVSDPIQMSDGVYILQLRDKHAGTGATLVNLKQAAIRLSPDATPDQLAAASAKLDKLKAEAKDCAALDNAAADVDGVVAGDLGETEVTDLSPEFRQVVDTLKVGQIGGPVRTKAGLHLVALCGRRASGPRSLSRDDIEGRLENEQLSMIARRYLRDLRNSATIESR